MLRLLETKKIELTPAVKTRLMTYYQAVGDSQAGAQPPACLMRKPMHTASRTLTEIQKAGVQPSAQMHVNVIVAASHAGQADAVLRAFSEAKKQGIVFGDLELAKVAQAFASTRDGMAHALQLVSELEARSFTLPLPLKHALMLQHAKSGDIVNVRKVGCLCHACVTHCVQIFDSIEASGQVPIERSYHPLIKAYSLAGAHRRRHEAG